MNDSARQEFRLPAGLQVHPHPDGLALQFHGDIVLEVDPRQVFGSPVRLVRSEQGSIRLAGNEPLDIAIVEAPEGEVQILAPLRADRVRARSITVQTSTLKAQVIHGLDLVRLLSAQVEIDAVVGRNVEITAGHVRGRATAIEASNELPPHTLKGGFSLEEFLDFHPRGRAILSEHGLDPQSVPPAAARSALDLPEHAAPAAEAAGLDEQQERGLHEAARKVFDFYQTQADVPAPVSELMHLVERRDYGALKKRINSLWEGLVKVHKKQHLSVSQTVTNQFQAIQRVVRKLPL